MFKELAKLEADKIKMESAIRVTTSVERKRIYEETLRKINLAIAAHPEKKSPVGSQPTPMPATSANMSQQPAPSHPKTKTVVHRPTATGHQSTLWPSMGDPSGRPASSPVHGTSGTRPRVDLANVEAIGQSSDESTVYTVTIARTATPKIRIVYPNRKVARLTEGQLRNRITRACRDLAKSKYVANGNDPAQMRLFQSVCAYEQGRRLIATRPLNIDGNSGAIYAQVLTHLDTPAA